MVRTTLVLFRLLNKGWRNNNKPENRKAWLPEADLQHRRGSALKSWQLQKHLQFKSNNGFLVFHSKLRTNKGRFKLQLNATNFSEIEHLKEHLGRKHTICFSNISTNCEYFKRIRISKTCTKHPLVHPEVTSVRCKQTSERHVALTLPRGEKWTPKSPTRAQRNQIAGVYHLCSERKSRWWPALASRITAIPQCHEPGTKRHCGPRRWDAEEPAAGNPFQTFS